MIRLPNIPQGEAVFEKYAVTVNGRAAQTYRAQVSKMPYNTVWPGYQRPQDQTEYASFLPVETDEVLHVEILYGYAPAEVIVRPLSKAVRVEVNGCRASFEIAQAGAYTVEADGFHEALHLFIDEEKDFGVCPDDENVIYFGAGVHRPGRVLLGSGQTVYIDRDAVVYGSFAAFGCENVRVCGRGIIDGSCEKRVTGDNVYMTDEARTLPLLDGEALRQRHEEQRVLWGGIHFWNCRSVSIEGCILRDSATFAVIAGDCDRVVIDDVKTIGMWRYNSDGIDMLNSRNVQIRSCFTRNFDDCIVIKGIMGHDTHSNENVLVENCVVWCDWGRALEIGAETCAPEYKNITFRNCDLIHGADVYMDIQHVNHAYIHDVLFDDIRLEYSKHHLIPVYQRDMNAPYPENPPFKHLVAAGIYIHNIPGMFCTAGYANGSVRNVVFRNIRIYADEGVGKPLITIKALDEEHFVEGVSYCNWMLNGKQSVPENFSWIIRGAVRDIAFDGEKIEK